MMKNKMFTRVLGMTCALIMAVTAIVPVCAKESGDQANSFRYENGQAAVQASTFADVYPNAWKKIAGKYRSSNGSIIQGAIARGIDVSHNQGVIDWQKVKAAGVEYAIIRCGYRGASTGALVEDPYFEKNIKNATEAGVRVGVYFFTQATTPVEAVEEASMVLMLCNQYKISFPLYIDTEGAGGNGRADGLDLETRTAVCTAFCETIENAGYTAGVYASKNWLTGKLDAQKLSPYSVWLAQYSGKPSYQGTYDMWQYTSAGTVDGISTLVDFNVSYMDY